MITRQEVHDIVKKLLKMMEIIPDQTNDQIIDFVSKIIVQFLGVMWMMYGVLSNEILLNMRFI